MKEHNSIITALARDDWQKIVLYECPADPKCCRHSIAHISRERGTDPMDTICDLLREAAGDDLHGLMVIALTYREEDRGIVPQNTEKLFPVFLRNSWLYLAPTFTMAATKVDLLQNGKRFDTIAFFSSNGGAACYDNSLLS